MTRMHPSPFHPAAASRPAGARAVAAAAWIAFGSMVGGACAQERPDAGTTPIQAAVQAPSSSRTRAEVLAELECARASGELDAAVLRSYGLEMQPLPRRPCTAAGTHPVAAGEPTQRH